MSAPAAGDEASPTDRQTAGRLRSGDDDETAAAASGVRGSMNVSLADSPNDCDGQCSAVAGWLAAPLTGTGFRPKRESQTDVSTRAEEQQRIALVTALVCGVCVLLVCGCESLRLRDWPRNRKPIGIRISIELDRARIGLSGRRRAVGATGGVTARLVDWPWRSA